MSLWSKLFGKKKPASVNTQPRPITTLLPPTMPSVVIHPRQSGNIAPDNVIGTPPSPPARSKLVERPAAIAAKRLPSGGRTGQRQRNNTARSSGVSSGPSKRPKRINDPEGCALDVLSIFLAINIMPISAEQLEAHSARTGVGRMSISNIIQGIDYAVKQGWLKSDPILVFAYNLTDSGAAKMSKIKYGAEAFALDVLSIFRETDSEEGDKHTLESLKHYAPRAALFRIEPSDILEGANYAVKQGWLEFISGPIFSEYKLTNSGVNRMKSGRSSSIY